MKKIICLAVCVALMMLTLVGCANDNIGEFLKKYNYKPSKVEDVTLEMYIVTDAATVSNAMITVNRMLSQYTAAQFHTTLNIHYYTEDQYEAALKSALDSEAGADIFLINSVSLYNELAAAGKLANLLNYLEGKTYGTLNTQIATSLLEAARADGKLLGIPNNHVVGHYEFLLIDKNASQALNYAPGDVRSFKTEDDIAELRRDMENNGYTVADCIKYVDGAYSDIARYEAEGYYCNVVTNPVATVEETFSSAFAISAGCAKPDRAMEIIYAINADQTVRNMLQYGVKGTNYELDENGSVVRVDSGENVYHMNIFYTGDIFRALYCEDIGWTATEAENGRAQNRDSVAYIAPAESGDTGGEQ